MEYYAIIYDSTDTPLMRVDLESFEAERRKLSPLPVPSKWLGIIHARNKSELEVMRMSGIITKRLKYGVTPMLKEDGRLIEVPE